MGILDLLEITDTVEIDIGLQQAPVGDFPGNNFKLKRFNGFVELQKAVLARRPHPEMGAPDLIKPFPLPLTDQYIDGLAS